MTKKQEGLFNNEQARGALRRALDQFKAGSPVEQTAVRAFEEHFDELADALQQVDEYRHWTSVIMRAVTAIDEAIAGELEIPIDLQKTLENDAGMQQAVSAAKASKGAGATFLRLDQCSHGDADKEGVLLYQALLTEVHKMGDILWRMPRGTYANMGGSMLWVSPLKHTPGADLFVYSCGGFSPELDGNGTYPVAYFDELGVSSEVVELTAAIKNWLNHQVFGQVDPDYLLDLVASNADCCKYSAVHGE